MFKKTVVMLMAIFTLCSGCSTNYTTMLTDLDKISDRQPHLALRESTSSYRPKFKSLKLDDTWGYDLRSMDITQVDLTSIDYRYFSYSTMTSWPKALPQGFDPETVLEIGKNPGLGIRELHDNGITGAGVSVAVIDQALLQEHQEYADRLMLYERIHCGDGNAQMHGAAVASLAVGESLGVAPKAKLYYIASTFGEYSARGFSFDASVMADCVLRILEINSYLPREDQIRVISISRGYDTESKGYIELQTAIEQADQEGVFVITTSTGMFYDFDLYGMGRDYMSDPDDFTAYQPAEWSADAFYSNPDLYNSWVLMAPMGSRTYACFLGETDYEISREGGLSWAVPWFAGFYALCCQVKPEITPQEFIQIAVQTSVMSTTENEGVIYPFGRIINPAAVIEALQP